MAGKPKRRPGRPRKSPFEKPEQFSIRLNPQRKLELALIARARNESLAQAVDYLISEASDSFVIRDASVKELVTAGLYKMLSTYRAIAPSELSPSVEEIWAIANKNPASNLALVLPIHLLDEDEAYFNDLLGSMTKTEKGRALAWKLAKSGHLDALIFAATNARIVGITPDQLTQLKDGSPEARAFVSEALHSVLDDLNALGAELDTLAKRKP